MSIADTRVPHAGQLASQDLHFEVEQFYYHEAALLDDGRFTDWLDLLDDTLDYWMPTRANRLRRQQSLATAARGEARRHSPRASRC